MENIDEEQDFLDTVEENGQFAKTVGHYKSIVGFLQREQRIFARSIALSPAEQHTFLKMDSDIDGCVVELSSLKAIKMPVRHITFIPKGQINVTNLKTILKKHVDLTVYTQTDIANFNNSVGFQMFYENGWECWVGLLPALKGPPFAKDHLRQVSIDHFQTLKISLRRKFAMLANQGIAMKTFHKNDINDLGRIFVLPDDSCQILTAVQEVLDSFSDHRLSFIVFCFRFGEKMVDGLDLTCFKSEHVRKLTVHSAITVISDNDDIDLMWSSSGIQEVIGNRGVLRTCLSFADCGAFQSNLDGRSLDLKGDLRCVAVHPNKVRFVQLYADIPHLKPKSRFHPVSGCVAGGRCFPKPTAFAINSDANRYIATMQNNWFLMNKWTCRIEFVSELPTMPSFVRATDCLSIRMLSSLLEKHALIVPFPHETLIKMREIGFWMVKTLQNTLDTYKDTGNIDALWKSYQLELALEKILWGNPLCFRSNQFSVNLGPGSLNPTRSLTDLLGCIAIESPTSCMSSDNDIPTPQIWTASEAIGKRIKRFCGMHDHLNASYCVLGRRILYALLQDLFEVGKLDRYFTFDAFLRGLTAENTKFEVVGAITCHQLVGLLNCERNVPFPMVFGLHCDIIRKNNIDLARVLEAGFNELQLHYIPAIQTYNSNKHSGLHWELRSNFWQLIDHIDHTKTPQSSQILTRMVIGELDRRRLIWVSKLKLAPTPLPWISICLKKLARERLNEDALIRVLVFISCIAFISQGWYVEYDHLEVLIRELTISQCRLKELEVLGKFELKTFNKFKLYKLHWTIPHKLSIPNDRSTSTTKPVKETVDERHDEYQECESNNVINEDNDNEIQTVKPRPISCLPLVQRKVKWSGRELELLNDMALIRNGRSAAEMYSIFKERCVSNGIPFRTFRAFENRLRRV